MWAVLNNCTDFFMEKIVTQSGLVLENQFYSTSILLGAHEEKASLAFLSLANAK